MFLLRHGQSYFNLHFSATQVDPGIEDPALTPLGIAQAAAAAARLAGTALTRLIVSPYTRALQTAAPILAARRLPVEVMQAVRERTAYACDVGSAPAILATRFPEHDFTHLPVQWWHAGPTGIEPARSTIARANAFRQLMAQRPDGATTVLVSHWGFLLSLTGRSLANGELLEYDPASSPPRHIDWNS